MLEKIEQTIRTGQKWSSREESGVDRLLRKFGLGKGRLDLELAETNYCLGDYVEGTLVYQLKKPQEASELWVEVRASQQVLTPRLTFRTSPKSWPIEGYLGVVEPRLCTIVHSARTLLAQIVLNRPSPERSAERKPRGVTRFVRDGEPRREIQEKASTLELYKHRERLDGYHLYDVGEHTFRLPLPEVIASPNQNMETPKQSWIRPFRGREVRFGRISWQVRAKLVIPWSLGVSDSKKFYVVPRSLTTKAPTNFCAQCGRSREPENNFCPKCGLRF